MDHVHDHLPHDDPGRHATHESDQAGNPVCYHQDCPVCGRNLRIRVVLLGRRVYCQHCGGGFIASDGRVGNPPAPVPSGRQSAIVDELIERASAVLSLAPGSPLTLDPTPADGE